MKPNQANRLAENLISKFGLAVKVTINPDPDGQLILMEPEGVHPNEGFVVKIQIGWRSLYIDLLLGKFAGDLLSQMENCPREKKQIFCIVAKHILDEKGILTFRINQLDLNPLEPEMWPSGWKLLTFSLRKTPLEINTDNDSLTENLINLWVERFFGCVIALSPLEEIEEEDDSEAEGLPEGASKMVLVNRYERNRYNRTICINFHGCICNVCKMDFGKFYGNIGNGFIHVHHITPLSKLGPDYIINPIEDLIPLCPNCHSMIHRMDPPYTTEELRRIINSNKV